MINSLFQRAAQVYQNRRRKQLWYRVVSGMACVVVFCTVYALILPAITLEKESACGMEEHTHTEECYITKRNWRGLWSYIPTTKSVMTGTGTWRARCRSSRNMSMAGSAIGRPGC